MKSPAFQWYPTDYLSSQRVQMMTLEQEGAYCRLLWYCWQHGTIPSDPKEAARLIGKGASTTLARSVLGMFLPAKIPGRLMHDRLQQEREKQELWRRKSSEGGRKSAEMRSKGGSTTVGRVVENCLQPNANSSSPSPSSSPKKRDVAVSRFAPRPTDDPLAGTIGLLKELGTALFGRPTDQWPTEPEQRAALEVVKRPGWEQEKATILTFGATVAPEDRRFEFPKTLFKLLDEWSSTLDKARTYQPVVRADPRAEADLNSKKQFIRAMFQ
jgi:uncharacterized protein YdaU (DUF1376 family)